jgi:ParB/RepB/Spo0J family partition protein
MSGEEQRIQLVPLNEIVPLPYNVCKMDSETELMLKSDMTRVETTGMYKIDPILLRRLTPEEIEEYKSKGKLNARWQIVDGHRRWFAAQELGWHEIRAVITDMTLDEAREYNYKKNKIRGSVDPMREAAYFRYLIDVKKMTADKIAEKFGISHRRVDQILSRIKGAEPLKKILRETGFPLEKAEAWHYEITGKVKEPEKQEKLAEIIVKEDLSRREALVAKEAIEKNIQPEKTVKIAKTVKREKLAPKEAKIIVEAIAKKPEAETLLELPKPKLIEEAKKIITPPPPPKAPEELAYEKAKEFMQDYTSLLVDYVYTRYHGELLKDVIKAVIWLTWNKLDENTREEIVKQAIETVKKAGRFEEPVTG